MNRRPGNGLGEGEARRYSAVARCGSYGFTGGEFCPGGFSGPLGGAEGVDEGGAAALPDPAGAGGVQGCGDALCFRRLKMSRTAAITTPAITTAMMM